MKRVFFALAILCPISVFASFQSTLYGDWLCWKARRSGLDFVIPAGKMAIFGPSKVVDVPLKRDSGYRIGWILGHACCDLNLGVRYTAFCTDGCKSFSCKEGNATRPHPATSGSGVGDQDVLFAKSRYDLEYDLFDIEVGSCPFCGMRPFMAARIAHIREHLFTTYEGIVVVDTPERTSCLFEKNTLNAYGLLAGCEWERCVYRGRCNFALQGRASASVLVGKFCQRSQQETCISDEELVPDLNIASDWAQTVSNVELAVGAKVTWCAFSLFVGYEMHNWIQYADFLHFSDAVLQGAMNRNCASLGFDGLYLRLSVLY